MTAVQSNGQNTGLIVGGSIAGVTGLGFGGYATIARARLHERKELVVTRTKQLSDAKDQQRAADDYLAKDRVHPNFATAAEAKTWLQQRFATSPDLRALTFESDYKHLDITAIGEPTRDYEQARRGAIEIGDGRSSMVVRAGEWYAPARLNSPLHPLEKTRTEHYTSREYICDTSHNPSTGRYEYWCGYKDVQRSRQVQYLARFDRFRGGHDGVEQAFTGTGSELDKIRTLPELRADVAAADVKDAASRLRGAERRVRFAAGSASRIMQVGGLGAAAVGAALVGIALTN